MKLLVAIVLVLGLTLVHPVAAQEPPDCHAGTCLIPPVFIEREPTYAG